MKRISTYITEKLHINKTTKIEYMYRPKDKDELIKCIKDKIKKEGLGTKNNPLDLNDIDTSKITNMSYLFDTFNGLLKDLSKNGHFDISSWNVSNVVNMENMFLRSVFDGDLSDWDVSNVRDMSYMFCGSDFTGENGDISDWNVSKVEDMYNMFAYCYLEKNPPKWYKE